MPNYKTLRFFAVSETGSCSPDYKRWEEEANCGHAHKTLNAAAKCLANKQQSYCNHGRPAGSSCSACLGFANADSTSALWYNGNIHNQHGERVSDDE